MLSFTNGPQPNSQSDHQNVAQLSQQLQQQQQQQPTLRLRDNPPPITPAQRPSRKRKSPPSNNAQDNSKSSQPPSQPVQHVLPPPHSLVHPMQGPPPLHPAYSYAPTDYTPGGMPPPHPGQLQPPPGPDSQSDGQAPSSSSAGRTLSNSKRAEQNRKAQRAFRERRDQHVKTLESRSQLLDTALASADEANRRWEECRTLVDQLRIENAALRAALTQAQMMNPGAVANPASTAPPPNAGSNAARVDEVTNSEGSKENPGDPQPDSQAQA